VASPSVASAYSALVAFGDSYTDTGNAPSSPPSYWNGRFSNGPLWIEDLSPMLGFSYDAGNNYAVSGSESDELGLQISRFPGTSDPNVLFAIWSGNNDFGNHLNLGTDDSAWTTRINGTVSSLMTASDLLYQKGARQIVLFNQIDLTRVPYILNSYSSSFRNYILGKIQLFNAQLASAIPGLLSSHPGLQVYLVDAYSDLNNILNNYPSLGFTKANVGAINDPSLTDYSFSGPGANYVFWDSQHPTAKMHGLIGGWVTAVLPPPPPPTIAISAPAAGSQFIAPATISVAAAVSANGWSINQVSLFSNGTLVSTTSAQPYTFSLSALPVGAYSLTVEATYGTDQSITSDATQVSVNPPPGSIPPPPWLFQDIGDVGQAGITYYETNATFILEGAGNDIWDVADAFQFAYQPFTGDGSIVGLVTSLHDTDGFAKAGLMLRESLDPGSRNVLVFVTPTSGNGLQDRPSANGLSDYTYGNSASAPYWLKLQRLGTNFNGYGSSDGINWILLGSVAIPMATNLYAGLVVTSHDTAMLSTATFVNVQVSHPAPQIIARPAVLKIARLATGAMQLNITGTTGATYVCQLSTNLIGWTSIITNQITTGSFQLQVPRTSPGVHSFYRALSAR
jgi:phospholipase/lecithinase/hemolysin